MSIFSSDEINFFKSLLDNEIRPDGRNFNQVKKFSVKQDILPSCLSSIEIKNKDTNIFLSLKAEITKEYEGISINCDSLSYKSFNQQNQNQVKGSNLNNISKNKELTLVNINEIQEVLYLIDKLILSKIDQSKLVIHGNNSTMYWSININIFSLEKLYLHNLQTVIIGVKELLINSNFPIIDVFRNKITDEIEYTLIENSYRKINFEVNDTFVIGCYDDNYLIDPSMEELTVIDTIILLSIDINNKIEHIETLGSIVDLKEFDSLIEFVVNVKNHNIS